MCFVWKQISRSLFICMGSGCNLWCAEATAHRQVHKAAETFLDIVRHHTSGPCYNTLKRSVILLVTAGLGYEPDPEALFVPGRASLPWFHLSYLLPERQYQDVLPLKYPITHSITVDDEVWTPSSISIDIIWSSCVTNDPHISQNKVREPLYARTSFKLDLIWTCTREYGGKELWAKSINC